MSLISPQIISKDPQIKQNWTDLNRDGRRMDKVIRICMTEFKKKDNPFEMRMSYADRLIKATQTKEKLAITVLGVKAVLDEAKKR
jgi:hypothetical protein